VCDNQKTLTLLGTMTLADANASARDWRGCAGAQGAFFWARVSSP